MTASARGATGGAGTAGPQGPAGPAGPAGSDADATAAIETHRVDTTDVHGIADTGLLIVEGDARLSDARAPTAHDHDARYYTEAEVDALLAGAPGAVDLGYSQRPLQPGRFYGPPGTTTQLAIAAGSLDVGPFWVPDGQRFDRLGSQVTTAAAGSTITLLIYADTGQTYPGALLFTSQAFDTSVAAQFNEIIDFVAPDELIWLGALALGGNPTVRRQAVSQYGPGATAVGGVIGAASAGYTLTGQAAPPNPFPANQNAATNVTRIGMRAA